MGDSRKHLNGNERVSHLFQLLPTALQAIHSASQVHQVTERACAAIGEGLGAQTVFVLWSGYGIDDAALSHPSACRHVCGKRYRFCAWQTLY
jgi:hypothetical protein